MDHTRTSRAIAYHSAHRIVAEATAYAAAKGWQIAAVVVDPSGHLVAAGRMDGVPAPVVDFASDKAFTAGTLGNASRRFFERMSSSPELAMGAQNRPRLCAWDGGLAIRDNGELIGGLGVSGAAGPDDVACAEHAITAVGLDFS